MTTLFKEINAQLKESHSHIISAMESSMHNFSTVSSDYSSLPEALKEEMSLFPSKVSVEEEHHSLLKSIKCTIKENTSTLR